ncbi:MAG: hypothetical protein DRI40_01890 [Chloroflexi bacterium]|nr:MAG: hypothetical protein DRI40_01890 [Chloroflexota bacterium]
MGGSVDLSEQRARYISLLLPLLAKTPRRLRVLVVGNYGNRNIGDEAILSSLLDIIEKAARSAHGDAEVEFYVPVRNAANLYQFHDRRNLHALPIRRTGHLFLKLLRCHLVVVGGGGMFSGYTGPLAKLVPYCALGARVLGKKVAYVGIGIYPTAPAWQRWSVWLSMLFSNLVCARDESSATTLKSLTRFKEVHVCPDLALFLADEGSLSGPEAIQPSLGAANDEINIGLSIKPLKDRVATALLVETFARIINQLDHVLRHRVRFVFFPFAMTNSLAENDSALGEALKSRMENGDCLVLLSQSRPREFMGLLGQMDLVIGMRLHSQVFAHLTHVPLIGIKYEQKNRDFLENIGAQSFTVDEVILQTEKVKRAIIDAIPRTALPHNLGCPSAPLPAS